MHCEKNCGGIVTLFPKAAPKDAVFSRVNSDDKKDDGWIVREQRKVADRSPSMYGR